jgi:hydrogenase maturation protease
MRTLVAGFGNVLRGDDGFGVAVIQKLQAEGALGDEIELMEVGTGGLRMAQELLAGYGRLIVVDAMTRGGAPGQLYVEEVESVAPASEVDLHLAVPSRALAVAQALGALPSRVFLVGCEPAGVDELTTELSAPVQSGVEKAVAEVRRLIAQRPGETVARRDEMLQLLYWLEGEGFAGSATLATIARFLSWPEPEAGETLARLTDRGEVLRRHDGSGEFELTEPGRREAARRFAEEFTPLLAQGHGECRDPNCECRTSPGGPAECRSRHP